MIGATARMAPGPRGHFLLGSLPDFARDRLGFFSTLVREYGDAVSFRLGPRPFVLLSHPDLVEEVLVGQNANFRKSYVYRLIESVLGNGLLTSEGDFWLRQRRLAQPAFHRKHVAESYGPIMVASAESRLARWRDGETRDVHDEMMAITLDIGARTLFGADIGARAVDVGRALEDVMESFTARFDSLVPLPEAFPTPTNLRLRRAVRRLDGITRAIIDERRRSGEERRDLLSMLLHAQDEDGSQMTDKQLRDEVMTLFLASHETTALALSWTWYLLAQHPETGSKLRAELGEVLGGRRPEPGDVTQLRYTEMVVLESMRLYPPAYAIGREAIRDCVIGGHRIPRGTSVVLCQWTMHRDPRYYHDPESFAPERWADGLAERLPRYAYLPFGGGQRICIGGSFAMLETVLLVAVMAQRFHFDLVRAHPVEPWAAFTLRPKHGVKMVLHALQ